MNPTSGVIGEAFQLYRAHWQHLLGIAAIVYVAVAVLTFVLVVLLGTGGVFIAGLISFVASFWTQAALVEAVEDIRDGRADLPIGATFQRVSPRLGAVIGASILAGIGIAVGLVLVVVPGLVLLTWWCVIVPAIVLEGRGAIEAFGRSRQLVRGYGWSVFGVIVVALLVLIGASIVLAIVFAAVGDASLRNALSNLVSGIVTAPFYALVATILYFRLRAAKEGDVAAPAEAV